MFTHVTSHASWSQPCVQPRFRVMRAAHLGMCFGVRDAIALALAQSQSGPITILGDLVHNESVLKMLRQQGVKIERQVASISSDKVIITAHGASQRRIAEVMARGHQTLEATCPLVRLAHGAVRKLVQEGYYPVLIGKRDHVEVRGITEDLDSYSVVISEADVRQLEERPRFGIAAQTTQPIDKVRHLVRLIRRQFPASEVRFIDSVCQPTKQRQHAAVELAQKADVVLVIGGVNSNNTRELVATCSRFCARVFHLQSAEDLRPHWFFEAKTVGITAGTSTPDAVIDEVERRLLEYAAPLNSFSHF